MDVEQLGSFRTRTAVDGSLEIWAHGWRLESQLYALIPMGLSLMFLLAPMSMAMRAGGALVMLAATYFVFRMTKPGLWFTPEHVAIVSVLRTQTYPWANVQGFMGERRHDEARILMILDDERRISLPGTLDPEELDPYGDEGQLLSAADQLNLLRERAVSGELPKPAVPVVTAVAPREDATAKEKRRERKDLRAALKAVRLPTDKPAKAPEPKREERAEPEPAVAAVSAPAATESRPRRRLLRRTSEPVPELTEVAIAEAAPAPEPPRRRAAAAPSPELPSYFPKPTYIPQEEYAQMLRDQKAAEKAAAAAAAELRQLAGPEEIDDLARKDEFSDWAS